MSATFECIAQTGGIEQIWIARGGPSHEQYGDPFSFSCVIIRENDTTARVEALSTDGSETRVALLSLRGSLRRRGFTKARWMRIRNVLVHIK